ncbi:hypothetical protein ACLOJK_009862, partial [Asimina triloba]
GRRGVKRFLERYSDAELRTMKNGQYVKVTGFHNTNTTTDMIIPLTTTKIIAFITVAIMNMPARNPIANTDTHTHIIGFEILNPNSIASPTFEEKEEKEERVMMNRRHISPLANHGRGRKAVEREERWREKIKKIYFFQNQLARVSVPRQWRRDWC